MRRHSRCENFAYPELTRQTHDRSIIDIFGESMIVLAILTWSIQTSLPVVLARLKVSNQFSCTLGESIVISPVCRPARRRPKRFSAPTVAIGASRLCIETRTSFSVKTATPIEATMRRATSFPLLDLLSKSRNLSRLHQPAPSNNFRTTGTSPSPVLTLTLPRFL